MPAKSSFNSEFLRFGQDILPQDCLTPIRLAAAAATTCENPVIELAVALNFPPFGESINNERMNGNRFLRRFGLAGPHDPTYDRARYVHRPFRRIDIAPLQTKQFALTQAGGCGEQH